MRSLSDASFEAEASSKGLRPPYLTFEHAEHPLNTTMHCPICRHPWHRTSGQRSHVYPSFSKGVLCVLYSYTFLCVLLPTFGYDNTWP